MQRLTRSEDCTELEEDSMYLSWTMMEWKIVGEVSEYSVPVSDICTTDDSSVSVFFPSRILMHKYLEDLGSLNVQRYSKWRSACTPALS